MIKCCGWVRVRVRVRVRIAVVGKAVVGITVVGIAVCTRHTVTARWLLLSNIIFRRCPNKNNKTANINVKKLPV